MMMIESASILSYEYKSIQSSSFTSIWHTQPCGTPIPEAHSTLRHTHP